MLRLLDTAETFNNFRNTKCAEVYCQNEEMHFSIVCIYCEMKTFEFGDFLLHFKNIHLQKGGSIQQKSAVEATTTSLQIKRESTTATGLENDVDVEEFEIPMSPSDIKFAVMDDVGEKEKREMDMDWRAAAEKNVKATRPIFDAEDDDDWIAEDNINDDSEEEYIPKILKKLPPTTVANKQHQCLECNKTYKKLRMLELHVRKYHRSAADVDDDKKKEAHAKMSSLEAEATVSMAMEEVVPGAHKCVLCDCTFAQERVLHTHQRKQHGCFPCPQCDRQYKNLESLRTHAFSHLGVRSFVCDLEACGKAFFNKKHLYAHKRIVHVVARNFVCEQCGWHSKQKGALTVHMRSHTGEKPYCCKECGKTFASSSLLIEHKPIHSAERPHVCDVCGAAFSRPKALYHHKFLHSDVKRFVCKICGKAYAQAAGLAGHMRQHRAQQEGVCTL